jgi:transcriptional regulator with XRE-family HTH domain
MALMNLVENIKSLCNQHEISIPKVEKKLGFGKGAIYNWDKNSPSIDKLQKVANYFHVSVDSLITSIEKDIANVIKYLTIRINNRPCFSSEVVAYLNSELEILRGKYYDTLISVDPDPMVMVFQVQTYPLSDEFKNDLLNILNRAKEFATANNVDVELSLKEERDIAHDLEKMLSALENDSELAFQGEPLDEDDREFLRVSLENSLRYAKQMAKKKFNSTKNK